MNTDQILLGLALALTLYVGYIWGQFAQILHRRRGAKKTQHQLPADEQEWRQMLQKKQ